MCIKDTGTSSTGRTCKYHGIVSMPQVGLSACPQTTYLSFVSEILGSFLVCSRGYLDTKS